MFKKIYLAILLFCNLSLSQSWIDQNIELTINCKFEQAISILKERIKNDSSDFKPHFYLAATLNSKMTHYENFEFEVEFIESINKTIKLINLKETKDSKISDSLRAQYYFYLGSAYGYLGFYKGRQGKWYTALSNGLEAIDLLETAVELDSTLYKAYLGIGTYDYWSSSKIKFALWFPLIPDNRDEGIKLIKKSLLDTGVVRYMSMHQLVYILIDYENFEEAQYYAKKIVAKYPESQFMWWAYAHVYYKMRDFDVAIPSYKYLLNLIKNSDELNPGHIIECHLKLAQLYYESNDFASSIVHCDSILNFNMDNEYVANSEDKIVEAKEYLKLSIEKIKESKK